MPQWTSGGDGLQPPATGRSEGHVGIDHTLHDSGSLINGTAYTVRWRRDAGVGRCGRRATMRRRSAAAVSPLGHAAAAAAPAQVMGPGDAGR